MIFCKLFFYLARNTELLQGRGNVAGDDTEWLNFTDDETVHANSGVISNSFCHEELFSEAEVLQQSQNCESSVLHSSICFDEVSGYDRPTTFWEPDMETESEMVDKLSPAQPDDCGVLQEDALEYIAGYIIKKLKLDQYRSTENSFTWVDEVSKGFLNKPAPNFLNSLKNLESVFYKVNAKDIDHRKNLQQHLVDRSTEVELPEKVKRFFFKCINSPCNFLCTSNSP